MFSHTSQPCNFERDCEVVMIPSGDEVTIRASARSFLHSQVRSMAGTLKKVGDGTWPVGAVAAALASRDRARSGPVAPAHGLYLVAVDYK